MAQTRSAGNGAAERISRLGSAPQRVSSLNYDRHQHARYQNSISLAKDGSAEPSNRREERGAVLLPVCIASCSEAKKRQCLLLWCDAVFHRRIRLAAT